MADHENIIDKLYDEDNNDIITLFNEKGEEIAFEQIALIPRGEETYVILKPVRLLEGMGEDEGLVFAIKDSETLGEHLELIVDEKIIDDVFAVYDDLVAAEYEED